MEGEVGVVLGVRADGRRASGECHRDGVEIFGEG